MAAGENAEAGMAMSRKEKRKLLKKEKRQQKRKEIAVMEKEGEEARLNDAEEQNKLKELEQQELEKMERDRREFEERERIFLEALELKRRREQEEYEQEQERKKLADECRAKQAENENTQELDEDSDWEYVEEGPAEIIWQGNEIIVKKKKVKVHKKNLEQQNKKEDVDRPISNPLAPQSEAFEDAKSAQQILDTVAQEVPNFGTEQDKAHCPFHLKTGACRFGSRCSRVHFYPDKSCTLLMKNLYAGPGLIWEQDEGLEHTEEEIEHSYEEFYEDVHTEFLKFGEIVNFKVCRNGSPHLRGNVYVHYLSLESAVLAYQSTNGRYFAGKQVLCEFVNLTRWKIAICGEFMRSRLKTCSRGSTCNFIHCFRNPGGDYEWADWDRAPPRYWINKMDSLFGNRDVYDKQLDQVSPDKLAHTNVDRRYSRSRSRELDSRHSASYNDDDNNGYRNSKGRQRRHMGDRERNEVNMHGKDKNYFSVYSNEEGQYGDKKGGRSRRRRSKDRNSESGSDRDISVDHRRSKRHSNGKRSESDSDRERSVKHKSERYHEEDRRSNSRQKKTRRDSFKSDNEEGNNVGRDKHRKRESSKHRKRERSTSRSRSRPAKSERRSSRQRKKESAWDDDQLVTADEGRYNPDDHDRSLEDAEFDQNPRNWEETGDGSFSRQEDSVDLDFENEQACRRTALENLQQKKLYNDVEAEPRKRRRI